MRCVAIDLGAESCRVSLSEADESTARSELLYRFANGPVEHDGSIVWDIKQILSGIETGLRMCAERVGGPIDSIGVDGWAVDYVRLDAGGRLLGDPFCYRDRRTESAMPEVWRHIPPDRLYQITGIQFLRFNTLYQLFADMRDGLEAPLRWLNLPEYVLFTLGAPPVAEYTNATHTQLVDAQSRDWSREIFAAAGLDANAAPRIVPPGTLLGRVRGPLSGLPAFRHTRLIAPACHDTGSAVAGIAATGTDWAFISSGTWSLIGTVLDSPCLSEAARRENFSNEGHLEGHVRFLKNVNGMWLIEECLREWRQLGYEWTVPELAAACMQTQVNLESIARFVVDAPELLLPGNMQQRITREIERAGGTAPSPVGAGEAEALEAATEWTRLIFVNLARRYVEVIATLTRLAGREFKRIYVVGGGSRNAYLNRLINVFTGLEILCGPVESSTIGNTAIQCAALERQARGAFRQIGDGMLATDVTAAEVGKKVSGFWFPVFG